ncbi:MAG: sterol desaturase family protein [Steroidobacteraceae bacterium]|nr:sterol desaturase family protein [Steroidobacteraceae bacterium]
MIEESLTQWAGHAFPIGLGGALLLLLLEEHWPEVSRRTTLGRRWLANAAAYAAATTVMRSLPFLSALGAARFADTQGWGLFNSAPVPGWIAIAFGVVALDLAGYAVHRLEHRVPLLWRVHRLHHSDPDVDATTAFRFHAFEIALIVAAEVVVVLALGVPVAAIVAYLLLSAVMSVLSHANVSLPPAVDRALRLIVITPRMHRVHHSIERVDYDSNFSVTLSFWDRLFRTYRHAPLRGDQGIVFGVVGRPVSQSVSIWRSLADPFLPATAGSDAETR